MKQANSIDTVAYALIIIGGLNWGVLGATDRNIVASILPGTAFERIVYILVGLAALYCLLATLKIVRPFSPQT